MILFLWMYNNVNTRKIYSKSVYGMYTIYFSVYV